MNAKRRATTWSNMYKHIIILEHGDSVMSSSMFFLVELYSLKHQARLTIEMPIEIFGFKVPRPEFFYTNE
jgi:hypothetical protein